MSACRNMTKRSKIWMARNMSDNQFRPEQVYCANLFAETLPEGWKIEMEYLVNFTHWNPKEKQPKKALVGILQQLSFVAV